MGRFLLIILMFLSLRLHAQEVTEEVVVEETETRFAELPDSLKVDTRSMDTAIIQKIENEEDYWYANFALDKKKKNAGKVPSVPWLKYILLLLFIAAVVYFISGSRFSIFRRTREGAILEDYSAPQEEINLQRELIRAEQKEDYRLAVRYQYLILLQNLDRRGYIKYDKEKTNDAYLSALRSKEVYKPFFKLTRLFEQVFYGGFDLNKEGYALVASQFKSIKL